MTDARATWEPEPSHDFENHRAHLMRLAYRMLGSVAEAEDAVQDSYLRWHNQNRDNVDDPRAYLSRIVTRLCLDRLKQARTQREVYIGPWLPEPLVEEWSATTFPANHIEQDVSTALMVALERLSPLERAAFILHDIFDMEFEDVAATLGRTPAACRQLASRARSNVVASRPRFNPDQEESVRLTEAFFEAGRVRSGLTACPVFFRSSTTAPCRPRPSKYAMAASKRSSLFATRTNSDTSERCCPNR